MVNRRMCFPAFGSFCGRRFWYFYFGIDIPEWSVVSRMATLPSCWYAPDCAMWLVPNGATKSTYEYEAPGGCPGGRLYCRLTSFIRKRLMKPRT